MSTSQPELNVSKKVEFDLNLEGMRGFLAIAVGFSHIFGITHILDPSYHPNVYWLNVGHGSVLLFFVMSGYVIGLTNPDKGYSPSKAVDYLSRRAVRLVPIYIFAVIFGSLIIRESWSTIVGNLIFLQNLVVPRIEGNSPVWSLNYEILYYLSFLLILWLRPRISYIALFCLALSCIGWIFPHLPVIITSYASGFVFWLFGLWLAWKTPQDRSLTPKLPLLSYALLFYTLQNFSIGRVILEGFQLTNLTDARVNLADLMTTFPICLILMARVSQRTFPGLKWIERICFLIPLGVISFLFLSGRLFEPRWLPASILYVLAISLIYITQPLSQLSKLAILGRISYGFYLVHFPLILLVKQYFPISGNVFTFGLRIFIWLGISLALSALLELYMQPLFRRWFYYKFPVRQVQ